MGLGTSVNQSSSIQPCILIYEDSADSLTSNISDIEDLLLEKPETIVFTTSEGRFQVPDRNTSSILDPQHAGSTGTSLASHQMHVSLHQKSLDLGPYE